MKFFAIFASAIVATPSCAFAEVYRGHLSIWPEAEVFTPCGFDKPLWLDFETGRRDAVTKERWKLQKTPYGTTFATIEGNLGPKLDCGFCEEYEGSFKVHRVLEQRTSSPEDCKS